MIDICYHGDVDNVKMNMTAACSVTSGTIILQYA